MAFGGLIPASLAVLVGSSLLDLFIGEPPEALHPVVWIGRVIELTNGWFGGRVREKLAGGVVAFLVAVISGGLAYLLVILTSSIWKPAGLMVAILLLKSTVSLRSLVGTVSSVGKRIEDEPERAREELLALVGRDRSDLSLGEMRSAAVESLFENLVDSFIAPLFYFFLGSLVGYAPGIGFALFYKAVNTLDSMLGYRTEELRNYGFLAARTDDVMNWIPARISVLFISLAAFSFKAILIALRDWDQSSSPNSGWPMATAAGCLGVKLVKRDAYVLGREYELPESEDIPKAVALAVRCIGLYLIILMLLTLVPGF